MSFDEVSSKAMRYAQTMECAITRVCCLVEESQMMREFIRDELDRRTKASHTPKKIEKPKQEISPKKTSLNLAAAVPPPPNAVTRLAMPAFPAAPAFSFDALSGPAIPPPAAPPILPWSMAHHPPAVVPCPAPPPPVTAASQALLDAAVLDVCTCNGAPKASGGSGATLIINNVPAACTAFMLQATLMNAGLCLQCDVGQVWMSSAGQALFEIHSEGAVRWCLQIQGVACALPDGSMAFLTFSLSSQLQPTQWAPNLPQEHPAGFIGSLAPNPQEEPPYEMPDEMLLLQVLMGRNAGSKGTYDDELPISQEEMAVAALQALTRPPGMAAEAMAFQISPSVEG